MKKTFLLILAMLCLCSLSAYAANTNSTKPNAQSSIAKTGQPPQNGKSAKKPDQKPDKKPDSQPDSKPTQKPAQKPNKKPDSKPGGDKVPPEFQKANTSSSTNSHSK